MKLSSLFRRFALFYICVVAKAKYSFLFCINPQPLWIPKSFCCSKERVWFSLYGNQISSSFLFVVKLWFLCISPCTVFTKVSCRVSSRTGHMDQQQQQGDKNLTVFVGPWGGNGGTVWDDGIYHGVREIKLVYDHCIDSISLVYDKNGKPVRSEKHGGHGGNKTKEIKLQYPDEYLIGVSGYYSPVVHGGTNVIRSMTFTSNKQVYGPCGVEQGTPFTFSVDGGRIVGMNGRSGWYLDSIGFRLSRPKSTKMIHKLRKKIHWLTRIVA